MIKEKEKLLKAEVAYLKATGWVSIKNAYGETVWKSTKNKGVALVMTQEIAVGTQKENDTFTEEYLVAKD